MKYRVICIALAFVFIVPLNTLAADTNYRFTGQELDKETGIYDYGARNYNPNTGRFMQQDPVLKDNSIDPFFLNNATKEELNEFLSNPQKLNAYSYTLSNPIKYVDPTGETEVPALLTPKKTATQVAFWLGVSNTYLRQKNWNISAAFLNNSLKLRVGNNLDLNINENNDKYNVTGSIKQSGDYQTFVQKRIGEAEKSGLKEFYFEGGKGTANATEFITFTEGDLKYSIHDSNIYINGKKLDNGSWDLSVRLKDIYDYNMSGKYNDDLKATIGANSATLSQNQGVISNYNINIQFNDNKHY